MKVKAEKAVKAEKVSKVKAEDAKQNKGKRRVRDEEEDHQGRDENGEVDAEGDEDALDEEGGSGSPKGRKRTRLNTNGDSHPADDDDDAPEHKHVATLPRDTDGFIPGSIVRIQLQNFVTYDWVEFRPGPYLNMIIGPNGTGKSSIACAICLGLGWSPQILGRASEINSFVKQGKTSGHIEIELKGPKGKPNLVIRRNLTSTSKTSTFTLNGVSAIGREISSQMAALNVQIGNLCTFLPQDKVSEFAAMSPQDLLKETQRAAGDQNLTAWHKTLIEAGADQKKINDLIKSEMDQLQQMRERNEAIERDVQRCLERQKIEQEIALLEVLVPVQRYREARERYQTVKAEQRRCHNKVVALKDKNAPAHDLLKRLAVQHKKLEKDREDSKRSTQSKFKKINERWNEDERLENAAEDLQLKLETLDNEEKDRSKKIKNAQANIDSIRKELAKEVKLENQDDLTREISTNPRADYSSRRMSKLKKLDNVEVRKLQMLSQWDRDTADAVVWYRNNKDKFRMEVFEPPYLSVNVPDHAFASAVEMAFSGNNMKTFVAQCQEDYDTLNRNINDNQVLGRKVWVTTWYRARMDRLFVPPPMERDELARHGFSGYLLDYVTCPQGLEWFLQVELNLHRIAVGGHNVDVNRAMDAVCRSRTGPANFIAGTSYNIVTRSRYGKKLAQNMTRDIGKAKSFIATSVDPEVKKRIDGEIAEHKQHLDMLKEAIDKLRQQLSAVEVEDSKFQRRVNDINARRDAIQHEVQRRTTLTTKQKRAEAELKTLLNKPSAEQERAEIKKGIYKISKQRVAIVKEYKEYAKSIIEEQSKATRLGLEFLQVGANHAALRELCNRKDERYNIALAEFNKADEAFKEIKSESKQLLLESRTAIDNCEPDINTLYEDIQSARFQYEKELEDAEAAGKTPPSDEGIDLRSTEELEAEFDAQKAQLEIMLNTNPGVIEEYEKRKRDIEALERTVQQKQTNAQRVEQKIKKARDNWEPALEQLVAKIGEKFSAAFDRIGCAGEIRIGQHEDYDKWTIDILVKFRDDEKLQLLTSQRQSGGERSLTTILYLMSLTEQARAPFSLVDEINQGMDQRAERAVHNNMVETTCKEESGQYFLITPKLLADLQYHKRMKVLCVNNGEWLPEERGLGNMMNMIEGYVDRQKHRATNSA
ncbi:P-loop containing nucleoside triphosphate hydrolase protein [Armillaria solidipes]|uniref:Structural maintenance of chromosomes protein 5 n=1 Tax=Armillaria solidipes TaxID=1076256 RepID=A0A2H3BFG5_9AGAR|nr:P-loop containing nucleoside triphosphate hydrolase protein [Armillaria solidipes]